jgi:hypothetical protein
MAGIFARRNETSPADFWRQYGERYGETVLAYALGQYISGWDDYREPFWGLLIATDGGFRAHHFPHEGWIQALSRLTGGGEPPQEKTIFIPKERIIHAELKVETSWWKKLLSACPPLLVIRYRKDGAEARLMAETEKKAAAIVQNLSGLIHNGE